MNKPHVHAALIKQWADGAEIECSTSGDKKWVPVASPTWRGDVYYRVKPKPKVKKYRLVRRTGGGDIIITDDYYRSENDYILRFYQGIKPKWLDILQRIEGTMIEVDDE